jgi:antitoxin VapB
MRTRIFQTGHSQAVCIPRELAFADDVIEVEIDRVGSTLVLRPSQPRTLADLGELLSMFSPHFMANGRDPVECGRPTPTGCGATSRLRVCSMSGIGDLWQDGAS